MRSAAVTICCVGLVNLLIGCAGKPPVWVPEKVNFASGERVEMPIDFPSRGLPTLVLERSTDNDEARVEQTLAIIDTGAFGSIVTTKYADSRKLSVRNVGEMYVRDAFEQTRYTPRVARFKKLQVGSTRTGAATFEEFDAVVEDFESLASLSKRLDVVLGRPVFRDVLLTIDYPNRKLILERGALPAPNGRDVLELKRGKHDELLIPMRIGTEDAWLILDTGHTSNGVQLSRYRLLGIRWASTPVDGGTVRGFVGEGIAKIGRMDGQAQLGQYTFDRPIIAVGSFDDSEYLGADILRHFAVTIDQKSNRVRLSRATTKPIESPAVMRFGFDFTDDKGTIEVTEGSAAQRAGLKTGDRVRSVNGFPVERMTYIHRDQIERNGAPFTVRFVRDGQDMVLRVPMTVIVR